MDRNTQFLSASGYFACCEIKSVSLVALVGDEQDPIVDDQGRDEDVLYVAF